MTTKNETTDTSRGLGYEDAIHARVTRREALAEVRKHDADESEFLAQCGNRETYRGGDVLAWLGY